MGQNSADEWMQDAHEQFQAHLQSAMAAKDYEIQQLHASHAKKLMEQKKRSDETVEGLQRQIDALQQRFNEVASLSDTRGKELAGAQSFLSKADKISVSEAADRVTTLNEEIFQAAASLAECIIWGQHRSQPTGREDPMKVTRYHLGDIIVSLLADQSRSRERKVNSLLVQVVVQAILVQLSRDAIGAFDPADKRVDRALRGIYKGIRYSENPAVSGRWRSLARGQIQLRREAWLDETQEELEIIFREVEWSTERPDQLASFDRHLDPIFTAIQDVRLAIGEQITSSDYEVSVVESNELFGAHMEEAYADARHSVGRQRQDVVILTTAMGVAKRVPQNDPHSTRSLEIVLRPKVVLEASLDRALQDSKESRRHQDGRG